MSTLANNKRSCSKKWEKSGQNFAFSYFSGETFSTMHDFVTPFSTFASIKGSLPTKSTTPDRLRLWTKTESEDFPGFGGRSLSKKSLFKRVKARVRGGLAMCQLAFSGCGLRGGSPAKVFLGLRLCGTHFLSLC